MDNPEISTTRGTQYTGQRKTNKNHNKKIREMSNTDPSIKPEMNPCAREGQTVPIKNRVTKCLNTASRFFKNSECSEISINIHFHNKYIIS